MLYNRPTDLDFFAPPYYPRIITIYCHCRWRMPELNPEDARASDVQRWETIADYERWEEKLRSGNADAWPEDSGSGVPTHWPRDSAHEVSDKGLRTGHVLLRPGQAPKAGWSAVNMFGKGVQSPMKLSDPQLQTAEQFMLMRSMDLAFNEAFDKMSKEERRMVKRLVIYGLPSRAILEPPSRGDGDRYRSVWQAWKDSMNWEIEVRDCPLNRNPAAYLSGCYNAPMLVSHRRGDDYRFRQITLGDTSNRQQERLLADFADAVRNLQPAKMGELYTLLLGGVLSGINSDQAAAPTSELGSLPVQGSVLSATGEESALGSKSRTKGRR